MAKSIVVCLDGTWNNDVDLDEPPYGNVWKIHDIVATSGHINNYYPGVGTNQWRPVRWLTGAMGKGVFPAARAAWNFIATNYQPGDRIFIFGFSRGAYAARHLAGMICRFGLPRPLEGFFRVYLATHCEPCSKPVQNVDFLGLFDCVPGSQAYSLTRGDRCLRSPVLEDGILHFRHAVSRDERRWSFSPITFKHGEQLTFEQPWFPGFHCDVGGGSQSTALSSFSLWWMLREAFGQGLDIALFDCPRHRYGNAIGILSDLDPEATGQCSDWLTTKLGLRGNRQGSATTPLPGPTPKLEDLDKCPRCGNDMFDYFVTVPGQRWLKQKGLVK